MLKLITALAPVALLVACVTAPGVTRVGIGPDLNSPSFATVYADSGVPGEILLIQRVDGAVVWEGNRLGGGYAKAVALLPGKHELEFRSITGEKRVFPMEMWLQADGKLPVDLVAGHHYVIRYDLLTKPGFIVLNVQDMGMSAKCKYTAQRQDGRNYFPLVCE
jgi:hypothetical protein